MVPFGSFLHKLNRRFHGGFDFSNIFFSSLSKSNTSIINDGEFQHGPVLMAIAFKRLAHSSWSVASGCSQRMPLSFMIIEVSIADGFVRIRLNV